MVEFGQYLYAKHTLQAASRDGAPTAILSSATHTQAQAAVSSTMGAANYGTSTYTLTFADASTGTAIANIATVTKGSSIKVTVTANYSALWRPPAGHHPREQAGHRRHHDD